VSNGHQRPDPDQLLRQVELSDARARRGHLKVFLGYASGVGKSFRMFDEGRRRRERGEDVIVGAIQPNSAPEVEKLLARIEVIPLIERDGRTAIDVEAITNRRPAVCLIDGLAYENPPQWPTAKRWQDVERLLEGGIAVITSLNVQHIEEKADEVARIRGRRSSSTVPASFISRADEIVVVDAPAEYCLDRARRAGGSADEAAAIAHQLSALREIALLLVADAVDHQLEAYLKEHGLRQTYGAQERILVCVTPKGDGSTMIRRGRRQADRFHGELHVLSITQSNLTDADRAVLRGYLALARELRAEVHLMDAEDPIDTIVRFAQSNGMTQIFVGHSRQRRRWPWVRDNPVERLIRESEGIDVRVFPN
jgi:two-component system sensor histidine kinase KdpD